MLHVGPERRPGYISLGKGITIHRKDCPNVKTLMRSPERFTDVEWDGVVDEELLRASRRRGTGRGCSRTWPGRFAEHGANIVSYAASSATSS